MNHQSIDDKWEAICSLCLERAKAENYDMDRLTRDEAEVVALWRLEADVWNGGFIQFFCNWGEAHCATALNALRRIGATSTLNVVEEQRNIVERLNGHPDLKEYWDVPKLLTEIEDKRISGLDEEFWNLSGEISSRAEPIYEHLINSQG
ncbi:MAG: DMP19 family protein [Proteobacteria bacterium]|nr:DMP19 family protein [Pseudomonadota bacterium]